MAAPETPKYDLPKLLAEIAEDEKVDRAAKRILSQADIQRLIERSRRGRRAAPRDKS